MSTNEKNPASPEDPVQSTASTHQAPRPRLTSAVEKWEREAGPAAAPPLKQIWLKEDETLLYPFTTSLETAEVHFLDDAEQRGYALCNGTGCLLCRIGRKKDQRDLLPVYDITERAVAVLVVPPDVRSVRALRPQLLQILRRVAQGEELLLTISKLDKVTYVVGADTLPEDADRGTPHVAEFERRLNDGEISLSSTFTAFGNEHLAGLPGVAAAMKAKGISL